MLVIRPIRSGEGAPLEKLAMEAQLGITSLPKNRGLLEKKIEDSLQAFSKTSLHLPSNEKYLFVLEEIDTGNTAGICAIYSKTGVTEPLYFFRIETLVQESPSIPMPRELKLLIPTIRTNTPTEIGTLFLSKKYRKEGAGRLLSLSRFLFMACFPERFDKIVFAELRGFINEQNQSPFWNGIGAHFLNIEYADLIQLRNRDRSFIPAIMPKYPLYASLLDKDTQEAIGKVHPNTAPALAMLKKEGFSLTDLIEFFDGGPVIEADLKEIRSIKKSKTAYVSEIIENKIWPPSLIVSNHQLDFRACLANVEEIGNHEARLNKETAYALGVKIGDKIRYVPHSEKSNE